MNVHLPQALKTGKYEIRTQAHVTRVELGADGLATGLFYLDTLTGEEHFQPAELVILSGYTLTNVKLLLVPRHQLHPDGIGNDRAQVGRNFTHQMWYAPLTGQFPGRRFNLYMGNTSTMTTIYDFYGMEFDHTNLDFIGGAGIYSTLGEREPITSAGGLPLGSDDDGEFVTDTGSEKPRNWGREWKESWRNHWDNHVPIAIQGDSFAYRNYAQRCVEIMKEMGADQIAWVPELPDYKITAYKSIHITGGVIMGSSPGNSVTNKYGQVWDTPKLFVTGAALYPQNPGANPSDTLCALAYMTRDVLVDRYFQDPNRLLG